MAVGDPDDWLQHARSDLRAAQLVRGDAEVLPSAAAFHAQQAAEKGLKAVLVHAAQSFPRTHDLTEILLRIDRAGIPVPVEVEAVRELTLFAVESRYPGDTASITWQDADEAIELARRAVEWASRQISGQTQ